MTENKSVNTKVQISFFKPVGYEDTWIVEGNDRGYAVSQVMEWYKSRQWNEYKFLNCIYASATTDEVTFPPVKLES